MIQFLMTFRHKGKNWRRERGYIMLTLMLAVALLTIVALTWVEKVDFQIKRDREEELIHRGVQYSRAVRRYFKKFGRYPTRVEELENTNNLRFLRRKYKDPITGKDFKLLHMTDLQMSFNSTPTGLTPISQMNAGLQQPGAPGAFNTARPGLGGPGLGPGGAGAMVTNSNPTNTNAGSGNGGDAAQPNASQSDDQAATQGEGPTPPPPQPLSQQAGPGGAPQVFGGGAIIGVASASKLKTIREFNKKDHYNQWQFIYDPTTDRGGLLMTPNQPPLQGAVQNQQQQQNGQPGTPGQSFSLGQGQDQNGLNPAPQPPQQPNPAQPEQ